MMKTIDGQQPGGQSSSSVISHIEGLAQVAFAL